MSDILLLNPPLTSVGYKTMNEFASRSFPLGLGSLSGILKKEGFSFEVLDADALNMDLDKLIGAVIRKKPKIIGISTYTSYADIMEYVVEEIKKGLKESTIVLGGHHAFAMREKLLNKSKADIVAIGEGEFIFSELCDAILNRKKLDDVKGIYFREKSRVVYTGDREYANDLDAIPMPAYECFPMDRYEAHFYRRWVSGRRKPFSNIVTSRGCPFSCGFCSNVLWGKRVRFQSPERVIQDIDYLVKNYGLKMLSFFDDTFTLDKKRAHRICDLIIERNYNLDLYCSTRVDSLDEGLVKKMARSGFKWIGIGIESGNSRILNKISKGQSPEKCSEILHLIADNGIAIYGSLILGYPGEDKKTLKDTLSFILDNPIHFPQINVFVPYPGTPIYDELVSKGADISQNISQLDKVSSYNSGISGRYLVFFLWYSYFRSLVRIRYFNLIRKTFKLRLIIFDFAKMICAMLFLNRKKRERAT